MNYDDMKNDPNLFLGEQAQKGKNPNYDEMAKEEENTEPAIMPTPNIQEEQIEDQTIVNTEEEIDEAFDAYNEMNKGGALNDLLNDIEEYPTEKSFLYDKETNKPKEETKKLEEVRKELAKEEDELISQKRERAGLNRPLRDDESGLRKRMFDLGRTIEAVKKRLSVLGSKQELFEKFMLETHDVINQVSQSLEKNNQPNEIALQLTKEDFEKIAEIVIKKIPALQTTTQNQNTKNVKKQNNNIWYYLFGIFVLILLGWGVYFKITHEIPKEEIFVNVKKNAWMKCEDIGTNIQISPQRLKGIMENDYFIFYGLIDNQTRKCKINSNYIYK